jgi:hypothetical protein
VCRSPFKNEVNGIEGLAREKTPAAAIRVVAVMDRPGISLRRRVGDLGEPDCVQENRDNPPVGRRQRHR